MTHNFNLKSSLQTAIQQKWSKFIENPNGFPHDPPGECWDWTGAKTYKSQNRATPIASIFGVKLNPRYLIYALHNNLLDKPVPHLKPGGCIKVACVNPLHQITYDRVYVDDQINSYMDNLPSDDTPADPSKDTNGHTIKSYMDNVRPCRTIEEVTGFLDFLGASPSFRDEVISRWKQ